MSKVGGSHAQRQRCCVRIFFINTEAGALRSILYARRVIFCLECRRDGAFSVVASQAIASAQAKKTSPGAHQEAAAAVRQKRPSLLRRFLSAIAAGRLRRAEIELSHYHQLSGDDRDSSRLQQG